MKKIIIALGIRRLVNKGILGAAIVINGGELGKKISLLKPENSETHYNHILGVVAANVALQYPQYKIVAVNGDTVPWHSYEYLVWKEAFGAANQAALNFWTSMN